MYSEGRVHLFKKNAVDTRLFVNNEEYEFLDSVEREGLKYFSISEIISE